MPTDVCLIFIMQKFLHRHIFSCPKTFGRQIAQPDIDPRFRGNSINEFLQIGDKSFLLWITQAKKNHYHFILLVFFLFLFSVFSLSTGYSTFFVNNVPTCVIESLPKSKKQYKVSILRLERIRLFCNDVELHIKIQFYQLNR